MSRFMMQTVRGPARPLSFSERGESTLVLSSASTPWAGIPFEVHEIPEVEEIAGAPIGREQGMMIALRGAQTFLFRDAGVELSMAFQPGAVAFADAGSQSRIAQTTGSSRAAVFSLRGYWQDILANGGPKHFSRLPPIPPSQTALSLALAITSEVETGAPSGAMFAESLSHALLHYVNERAPVTSVRVHGRLSDQARRRIARYIDDSLHEDLRLRDLSALTGLQPRHFSTLFREAFGLTPHRYLVERRLLRASQLLVTTSLHITELALSLGFASQSHFSTVFRKRFGESPRSFALRRRRSSAGAYT